MKLAFKKDEENQIKVFRIVDGTENNFSYVEMIKSLIESKVMEEPEVSGNFTDAERKSIKDMTTFINKEVAPTIDSGEQSVTDHS